MRASCVVVLAVAACGTPGLGDHDGGNDGSIDTSTTDHWTTLIERNWTINAPYDGYKCRVARVPEDMYISGYRLLAPTGTHHTILTITNDIATGDTDCTPKPEPSMLYAGGIGTSDVLFPGGVAIKLSAGQYIRLELHLYNASDNQETGTSGLQVKTIPASQVANEADMVFLGNVGNWNLSANPNPQTVAGSCSVPGDWHLFSLWPHMHGYGTHQTVTVTRNSNGQTLTLLDQPYDLLDQKMYMMSPDMPAYTNDTLGVTCSYVNTSGGVVFEGENSTSEMCLTGLLKWPKGGTELQCASL